MVYLHGILARNCTHHEIQINNTIVGGRSFNTYAQEFIKGTIITQRYDTIADVQIKKISDAKSTLHVTYVDKNGTTHKPDISTIKCYTRGDENFVRIYNNGEMILVKQLVAGTKLNLYYRNYSGVDVHYIEKVFDELIKVPSSKSKFKRVLSSFFKQ